MADFSLIGGFADNIESGIVLATVDGTTVTASGSTNTVGAFADILTAANNTTESDNITVVLSSKVASQERVILVSIAIGGAGSEVVIIDNMYVHTSSTNMGSFTYNFPIKIPSGVRISARCQSRTASAFLGVHIIRGRSSFSSGSGLGKVTTYGADTSDSAGTTVARSTAGTFGSWVEIVASTSDAIKGFAVVSIRAESSWAGASKVTYELSIGSAGNEEIIFSGMLMTMSSIEAITSPVSPFIPVGIPSGSRISIRAAGNLTNADLDHDYIIYGVS